MDRRTHRTEKLSDFHNISIDSDAATSPAHAHALILRFKQWQDQQNNRGCCSQERWREIFGDASFEKGAEETSPKTVGSDGKQTCGFVCLHCV